jgi:hypothetical protein
MLQKGYIGSGRSRGTSSIPVPHASHRRSVYSRADGSGMSQYPHPQLKAMDVDQLPQLLVDSLASQVGVVLANAGLTGCLKSRRKRGASGRV